MSYTRGRSSFSSFDAYNEYCKEEDRKQSQQMFEEIDESIQKYDALRAEVADLRLQSKLTIFKTEKMFEDLERAETKKPETTSVPPPKFK